MKKVVGLLTINNATMNDSGIYKCDIKDHNENINMAEKYLHISGMYQTDAMIIACVVRYQVYCELRWLKRNLDVRLCGGSNVRLCLP